MRKSKYDLFLILKKLKKNKTLNNISTLNNEKRRLEFIRQTLTEMSGSELKGRAAFSDNLLRKLEVSKNREAHLLEEIKDNLNEVSKIEKQKEKIIKRKEELRIKQQNFIEMKKENINKTKNLFSS